MYRIRCLNGFRSADGTRLGFLNKTELTRDVKSWLNGRFVCSIVRIVLCSIIPGSFFAAVYALTHVWQIFGTEHSKSRKAVLLFESVYNLVRTSFVVWLWQDKMLTRNVMQFNLVFS